MQAVALGDVTTIAMKCNAMHLRQRLCMGWKWKILMNSVTDGQLSSQ
jgi:hypothetical protein